MWIPKDQVRILADFYLGLGAQPDGTIDWRKARQTFRYIPPGFVNWGILDVGNGDGYGYYWPLGLEEQPPIAVTTLHDEWRLLPVASGLDACLLLMHAADWLESEVEDLLKEFGLEERAAAIPVQTVEPESEGGVEFWGIRSPRTLLPIDPRSPHLLLLAAKEEMQGGDLEEALRLAELSLAVLPEYAEAIHLRVQVFRRQRRIAEAAQAMLEYLTAPMLFGGWSEWRKVAEQIKRLPDDTLPGSLDPYWSRRKDLTLAEGVKRNPDYLLYEEMVEEYHRLGLGVRAVWMRIRIGEMMMTETVSFHERYGWSPEEHHKRLRADVERAGLVGRLEAFG